MATVDAVRMKALALDFVLASVLMGAVFTPLLAALSVLDGTDLLIGFWATAAGIVGVTPLVARRFDIPFPPWRPLGGRITPGKKRYPEVA
jgi:hypothetical protein